MSSIAKSQSLMRQLKDNLSKRLSTLVFTESLDAQGAILLISDGTPSTGEQVCAIRIKGENTQFDDSIGLDQRVYSIMIAQVIEETSSIANVSLLTMANKARIDYELGKLGIKQERYMTANGTVPAVAMFNANGNVDTASFVIAISDLYWPQSGQ